MNIAVRYSVILGGLAIIAAAALAGTYALTAGKIQQREAEATAAVTREALPKAVNLSELRYVAEKQDGGLELVPGGEADFKKFKAERGWVALHGVVVGKSKETVVGYVAPGEARGYSSLIQLLVGLEPDCKKILAVTVKFQQETPGLGDAVARAGTELTLLEALRREVPAGSNVSPFLQRFYGAEVKDVLEVNSTKDLDLDKDGEADAMTGATVTSDAALRAIQKGIRRAAAVCPK